MAKFLLMTFVGLIGAALVHLAIVLMLPRLSENDVWRQIETETAPYRALRLDSQSNGLAMARSLDPMFTEFVCRYDLVDGMFTLTNDAKADFWSVAIFDDRGRIVFSSNDRISPSRRIRLGVAMPAQIRAIQQDPRDELRGSIVAEARRSKGFAIVRLFRPDPSWEQVVQSFIAQTRCAPVPV